ncbi:hypothetical protein JB92DRAFT_2953664 [Gautieria morchelliformis]|nr:hypothetical protein JB92DRAFT_2953664 [Gautieria morchelliformis]
MSASAPDNSCCATDVPGEGCGQIFSRKTAAGLCARCRHLTKIADDALKHRRFATAVSSRILPSRVYYVYNLDRETSLRRCTHQLER